MMLDEKIVEAVALSIKRAQLGERAELSAGGPWRDFEMRAGRAAITAFQAEVEKERTSNWWDGKAKLDGFETKIDWIRHYRARTGCSLKQALAAYDADQPLPPAPKASS